VAKDFDLRFNDKSKDGQRPPRPDVIAFDSARRGRNDFRPVESDKSESEVSWPGFWPRWASAGPMVLLGIAISIGLYTCINYEKSTAQLRPVPTSRPASPVQPSSKPSPSLTAVTARGKGSIMPENPPNAVSTGFSPLHYHPAKYEATHKKVFGSCTGQLELTSARLHFRCPNEPDLNIPVGSIAKAHKDGVVLESGEKYHFLIANHTKDQVEAIFAQWLNKIQQPSRE
jgi:hypothetical protein